MEATELQRLASMGNALDGEEWRAVPGYERTYAVSSLGRIYSKPRPTTPGGILRGSLDNYGYRRVALVQDGRQRTRRVHLLVMGAFCGPTPDGMEVLHVDGDRDNPALANLRFGTHAENMADMIRHGTTTRRAHCKRGHEMTPENTGRGSGTSRVCLACKRLRWRERNGAA